MNPTTEEIIDSLRQLATALPQIVAGIVIDAANRLEELQQKLKSTLEFIDESRERHEDNEH